MTNNTAIQETDEMKQQWAKHIKQGASMTDRELLNRVAQALNVAQSLLGRSRHHNQILDAYIELRQAIAEPDDPFYCGDIDEESKAALAQPEREWVGLTEDERNEMIGRIQHDQYTRQLDLIGSTQIITEMYLKERNT